MNILPQPLTEADRVRAQADYYEKQIVLLRGEIERRLERTSDCFESIARDSVDRCDAILAAAPLAPPRPKLPTARPFHMPRLSRKNFEKLESCAAEVFGVPVVLLQSSTRVARVSSARHALWWVARHRFGETFAAIGSRCGRGHAAVVHGVRRVEEELRSSKDELMPLLERIAGAVKVDTKREKPPVPVAAFRKGAPTALATLADAAAEAWGVPLSKLFRASRRQKHCAEARWTVFWIAREHMALSLAVIARLTGKSAHTSVLFGVSRLQELIAADVHARGRVATVLSVSQNIDLTEATAFVNERSLPCTKD